MSEELERSCNNCKFFYGSCLHPNNPNHEEFADVGISLYFCLNRDYAWWTSKSTHEWWENR